MVGDDLRVVAANRQVCPTISEITFGNLYRAGGGALGETRPTLGFVGSLLSLLRTHWNHEPAPHPFPLPIRWGEGGRRSGEERFKIGRASCRGRGEMSGGRGGGRKNG